MLILTSVLLVATCSYCISFIQICLFIVMITPHILLVFLVICLNVALISNAFMLKPVRFQLIQAKSLTTQNKLYLFNKITDKINFEEDREELRKLRRTIFTYHDWLQHRSSNRYYFALFRMHRSAVLRSLTNHALGVASLSSIMVIYNLMVEYDLFPTKLPLLTLPSLPFSLISPSLGLLLVFRTNTAYSRWNDARNYWSSISSLSFSLIRQAVTWIPDKRAIAEISRYVVAFAKTVKWHLGNRSSMRKLEEDLDGCMTAVEIEELLSTDYKPQYIITHLSKLITRQHLVPNIQSHFDRSLMDLTMAFENCDRIFTTPIPLVYTRLTARFLLLWTLAVPLTLYTEFSLATKWLLPIITFMSSIFLFGIEDLGIQIEEPFSILPLANICYGIQDLTKSTLQNANITWFQGIEPQNIPPSLPLMESTMESEETLDQDD